MTKGSTLIELIVYLALFSIIMGGAVTSVYSMAETSGSNETKVVMLAESLFLQAKIQWALSSVDVVYNPITSSTCTTGCSLSIKKQNPDGRLVVLSHEGNNLVISYDDGEKKILNSSSIVVSGVSITSTDEGEGKNSIVMNVGLSTKDPHGALVTSSFSVIEYVY
jgi:type II secretory pathway pseudopilin PulG